MDFLQLHNYSIRRKVHSSTNTPISAHFIVNIFKIINFASVALTKMSWIVCFAKFRLEAGNLNNAYSLSWKFLKYPGKAVRKNVFFK